ncbi:MAG: hypothetical protein PVI13_13210, partial [Desulfobacterales bacterium]
MKIPIPKEAVTKIMNEYNCSEEYVIGQEEYKKRLSIAAAYHFSMIKHLCENPATEDDVTVKRFR